MPGLESPQLAYLERPKTFVLVLSPRGRPEAGQCWDFKREA
jgi:hypothetical protein